MLDAVPDPLSLGDSSLVDGFIVETHTLGCRNHGGDFESEWWERHGGSTTSTPPTASV